MTIGLNLLDTSRIIDMVKTTRHTSDGSLSFQTILAWKTCRCGLWWKGQRNQLARREDPTFAVTSNLDLISPRLFSQPCLPHTIYDHLSSLAAIISSSFSMPLRLHGNPHKRREVPVWLTGLVIFWTCRFSEMVIYGGENVALTKGDFWKSGCD